MFSGSSGTDHRVNHRDDPDYVFAQPSLCVVKTWFRDVLRLDHRSGIIGRAIGHMIQRSCTSSRNIKQKNYETGRDWTARAPSVSSPRPHRLGERRVTPVTLCITAPSRPRGVHVPPAPRHPGGRQLEAQALASIPLSVAFTRPLDLSVYVYIYIYRDLSIVICVALSIPHSLPRNSVYQDLYIHDICPAEPKWVVRHQRPLGATPQRRSFRPSIAPAIPLSRWAR